MRETPSHVSTWQNTCRTKIEIPLQLLYTNREIYFLDAPVCKQKNVTCLPIELSCRKTFCGVKSNVPEISVRLESKKDLAIL